MRRTVLMALFLIPLPTPHTVRLKWTQSPSPGLAYNTVYCGTKHGGPYTLIKYQSLKPVTSVSKVVNGPGTYYCVVTVTNGGKIESLLSNETKVIVP